MLKEIKLEKDREKTLERKLVEKVKLLGGLAIKLNAMYFTGLPDRLVLIPDGKLWFAEIKTTGKKPNPRQLIVHALLRKLGFDVWVIDTERALRQFLKVIETC